MNTYIGRYLHYNDDDYHHFQEHDDHVHDNYGDDDSLQHGHDHHHHSEFGVHITYEELYNAFFFLASIYTAGLVSRWLKMPSLVGEIFAGICLGPPLLEIVPNPAAWVKLGELGLVLLVVEAGIDIDVATLKLIGKRGLMIAIIGSILPIILGIGLAIVVNGTDMKAAIAAGATFGPTSLGIALNILRSGGVLNTPVGQLVVSAAVIDDMIALIVLSQLESLKGTVTASGVFTPIISAVLFLVIGGYVALFIAPWAIERLFLSRARPDEKGKIELTIMFGAVFLLMPATHYSKASYLMGAFIAGLSFCTSNELHHIFVGQFKRLLQWLMRIFFAASIGFQVPVVDFFSSTVILQGLFFTLALLGKLVVGLMVPNFTQAPSYTGTHLRDCLITGLSMAAEGEFAFVIAVFAVDNGMIGKELYASVVLAVLFSTILPPFLLRAVINHYNKKAEEAVQCLARDEDEGTVKGEQGGRSKMIENSEQVVGDIKKTVFFCIQTKSDAKWGLIHNIMSTLAKSGLDIIDHRSWHPPGVQTMVVNEIYVKDTEVVVLDNDDSRVKERKEEIQSALTDVIDQRESSVIKVMRWYPGVVDEITGKTLDDTSDESSLDVQQRLLQEASVTLARSQSMATTDELVKPSQQQADTKKKRNKAEKKKRTAAADDSFWTSDVDSNNKSHHHYNGPHRGAEILIDGKRYPVRIDDDGVRKLKNTGSDGTGCNDDVVHHRGVVPGVSVRVQYHLSVESASSLEDVVDRLQGFIRHNGDEVPSTTVGMIDAGNSAETEDVVC